MEAILAQLQADPLTNGAVIGTVSLAVLGFLTGTLRSLSDGTFNLALVDVWVRKTLLGRVLTIVLVLGFGRFIGEITIGDLTLSVLTGAGLIAAATFAAAELKSIQEDLAMSAPNPLPVE